MQPPRRVPVGPPPVIERAGAIGRVMRFLYQFMVGLTWVYEHTLRPLSRPVWRGLRYLFRRYRLLWDRVVYLKTGHFSRVRAGAMILATAFAAYIAVPVAGFVFDAGMFAITYDKEEIYLTFSQEIDPAKNLHSVKGCEDLPCTEANSVYYRVREDPFNSLWSIIHHGNVFYPDYVAAAVPAQVSKCSVTSYGLRLKFAMRQWEIYPDMLEAHCQPLTGK